MAKNGVVLLIDDDKDDQEITAQALSELNIENTLVCLDDGEAALQYLLKEEPPFLILCDVKLSRMSGLQLRRKIEDHSELRKKSIPFVFFSTTVSKSVVDQVYEMNVQGLFEKGNNFPEIKALIKQIYEYWQKCKHPKSS